MKLNRFSVFLCVLVAIAVVLSGCGSDNKASAPSAPTGAPSGNVSCGGTKLLKASGSTSQDNVMPWFVRAFKQACPGQNVKYTADGGAAGVREFTGKQTDFAGSDSPLSPQEYAAAKERCGSPAWNLPVVFGPLAITYNVNGLDSLNLDGPTAARIFNGAITVWNDPALQALNKGATLPAEPIRVMFHSEESGTTENFQEYLDTAGEGAWGKGADEKFNGGVGQGAMGDDGVADAVRSTEGSITYAEWSFAQERYLDMAKIITSAGPDPVAISTDSVQKTIATAGIVNQGNDLVLDTISFYRPNQPGAYPIVLATYEIVCSKYPDPQTGMAVKAFLQSTIGAGQNGLAYNGYVPIPDVFKQRLSAAVNALA